MLLALCADRAPAEVRHGVRAVVAGLAVLGAAYLQRGLRD